MPGARCQMAQVRVNGQVIMLGNFWDFHPECHGFDLPRFHGADDLARLLTQGLTTAGHAVDLRANDQWTYKN